MTAPERTIELRLRDFPKVTRDKVNAYRRIMQQVDGGGKPSFKDALIELINHSYKELAVKRIENDQSPESQAE